MVINFKRRRPRPSNIKNKTTTTTKKTGLEGHIQSWVRLHKFEVKTFFKIFSISHCFPVGKQFFFQFQQILPLFVFSFNSFVTRMFVCIFFNIFVCTGYLVNTKVHSFQSNQFCLNLIIPIKFRFTTSYSTVAMAIYIIHPTKPMWFVVSLIAVSNGRKGEKQCLGNCPCTPKHSIQYNL